MEDHSLQGARTQYFQVNGIVDKSTRTCNRIYHKYLKAGTVDDSSRIGRPPKRTLESEERFLIEIEVNPNLFLSAFFEESKVNFSKAMALRVLKDYGFRSRVVPQKLQIGDTHRRVRLEWVQEEIHKSEEFYFTVVFSDDCRVQRNLNKQLVWVARDVKLPSFEVDRWRSSLMIWGALSYDEKSILEIRKDSFNTDKY